MQKKSVFPKHLVPLSQHPSFGGSWTEPGKLLWSKKFSFSVIVLDR